jgi:hypothetical protein
MSDAFEGSLDDLEALEDADETDDLGDAKGGTKKISGGSSFSDD